jgi:hypothetical protein
MISYCSVFHVGPGFQPGQEATILNGSWLKWLPDREQDHKDKSAEGQVTDHAMIPLEGEQSPGIFISTLIPQRQEVSCVPSHQSRCQPDPEDDQKFELEPHAGEGHPMEAPREGYAGNDREVNTRGLSP